MKAYSKCKRTDLAAQVFKELDNRRDMDLVDCYI
jgi:pentatricopeptide repeat protein